MNTLILNTASINSEISLKCKNKIITKKLNDSHSEHLLPTIDELLTQNNLTISNIDYFGINLGPGSFTGIRIGVSTIKAFLFNSKSKCVQFNSFDTLAYNIKDNEFIVVVDSGNKDYYYAHYKDNNLINMSFDTLDNIKKLAKENNIKIYASLVEKDLICDNEINFIELPEYALNDLVENKINKKDFCECKDLCPIYVKRSQAEVGLDDKIKQGLKIEKCVNYLPLISIENECFPNPWSEQTFKQEFEQSDRFYYVAKVFDETVGYIGLWKTGDDLNILKVAVLPRFRQLGIATKLIKQAVKLKQELNLDKMFLEVDDKNNKAIALYEKCGFVTKYTRVKYYQNGNDCNVMFLEN